MKGCLYTYLTSLESFSPVRTTQSHTYISPFPTKSTPHDDGPTTLERCIPEVYQSIRGQLSIQTRE